MFERVLIANRGEIALHMIRACGELGIKTVAVYSEVDDQSLHVQLADEAVCIGDATSANSYLRADRIRSAAEITKVEVIHPDSGFLSENPTFAQQCQDCKIAFIGPSPETIFHMDNRSIAKSIAKSVRVPCVPGSNDAIDNEFEAKKLADSIGYPIMVQAAAGGGGKGMRLVHNSVSFCNEYKMAGFEAEKALGNGSVCIEKYIEEPITQNFKFWQINMGR
jgi:acetyl-CoA carboxylase biotin carboxylase subunit